MTYALALSDSEQPSVVTLLRSLLPSTARVWVFGSRAVNQGALPARPPHDLDLLIDFGRPITLAERAKLEPAFEYPVLPFRVDLVDRRRINERFEAEALRKTMQLI